MTDFELFKRVLDTSDLSSDDRAYVLSCFATRGKNRGYLKEQPGGNSDSNPAWWAWQALMSNIAPVRCAVWSMMFGDAAGRERYERIDRWATQHAGIVNLLCAQPYRFSMWAHNVDRDRMYATLNALLDKGYRFLTPTANDATATR